MTSKELVFAKEFVFVVYDDGSMTMRRINSDVPLVNFTPEDVTAFRWLLQEAVRDVGAT